jgi:large subunit ribosomal protein L25
MNGDDIGLSVIPAQERSCGTGAARALRRNGMVPASVYGTMKENLSISLETKEIMKICRKPGFFSKVIEIELKGEKIKVLPQAIELHPVTDIVRHVDFMFLGEKTHKVLVPLIFEGKERSPGIKRGGYFNTVKRSIKIECDSDAVPSAITIDVSNMRIGQSLKAKDLPLPSGSSLLCSQDTIVASIIGNKGSSKAEDEEKSA